MPDLEQMEAEIAIKLVSSEYSHAENILVRLNQLEKTLPYEEAVHILHGEVVTE